VECVHNVASALDVLSQRMASSVFRRFPKLAEICLAMTGNIIQESKDKTRIIVEQQVACTIGYLFTNDPSYLTEHGSMEGMYEDKKAPAPMPVEEQKKDPSFGEKAIQQVKDGSRNMYQNANTMFQNTAAPRSKELRYSGPFVKEIRRRLDSYLAITVRNVRDAVPKAIGFYLVRHVMDKLQFELLNTLNQKDKISELLGEPPHIMEERKSLSALLDVLQRASQVLTRDPTLAAIAFEAEDEDEQQPVAQRPQARPAAAQPAAASVAAASPGLPGPAAARAPAPAAAAPAVAAPPGTGGMRPVGTSSMFGAAPAPTGKPGLFDEAPAAKKAATKNPLFGD
jgi:dynamin 1-like protein